MAVNIDDRIADFRLTALQKLGLEPDKVAPDQSLQLVYGLHPAQFETLVSWADDFVVQYNRMSEGLPVAPSPPRDTLEWVLHHIRREVDRADSNEEDD